ncbi:helix-turn-helix transcriptional regulator [Pseudoclavibacter chungangensis]|uniref:Helix-turn-helix transcriptional regulator n=1 Tax=Pseudoclavibacter chungangensis TaxID=587635 RepID=A0A7J5BPC5_9MICO|nr:metalloregulator ArsR/SmtB family transcription factor [Pseudoclavibacter chungangensis]KAB1654789.1 helix-turn-helix transcriptional regulator [Pseudoclavibacter chungangensis]NYJ68101.1 DNA-binding transcriptional ArsR family regulator [Pseudoclavibacter chungangensis]
MDVEPGVAQAAQLFKVLGSASRLGLLHLIGQEPRTVSALSSATGLSQPLVSQHLRTLRQAGLVTAVRHGKEAIYEVADHHVTHVIQDALTHVREPHATEGAAVEDVPRIERKEPA